MKKYFLFLSIALTLFVSGYSQTLAGNAPTTGNGDWAGYLQGAKGFAGGGVLQAYGNSTVGWLDTLTNADTTYYVVFVSGPKDCITFQVDVLKITGTVAGTIRLEGSANGTTWETALVTTATTITDASVNYVVKLTNNAYKKYRFAVIGSGTNTMSNRCYLLYRKKP